MIVDVDAGSDDAIAILMLLSAHKKGEINLKAITCVAGNTKLNNVATNVLRVLEAASALNVRLFYMHILVHNFPNYMNYYILVLFT